MSRSISSTKSYKNTNEELSRGYAVILALLSIIIYLKTTYPLSTIVDSLINNAFLEEYSYITVLLIEIIILFLLQVPYAVDRIYLNFQKLLLFIFYMFSAGILYIASNVSTVYGIQLMAGTLVSILLAVLFLILGPTGLKRLFPLLLAVLFLIPLPRNIIEIVAIYLSKIVGRQVAWLTSSSLIVEGNQVILDYGTGRFKIVYACSGIVSITSILALFPVILFLSKNIKSIKIKLIIVTISLSTGALIAYIGNLFRVILLVESARRWGEKTALNIFHSIPSVIYVTIATIVSIILTVQLSKRFNYTSSNGENNNRIVTVTDTSWKQSIIAMLTIILLSLSLFTLITFNRLDNTRYVYLSSSYLEENIAKILMSNYTNLFYRKIYELKQFLGSSEVYYFTLFYGNNRYQGYIEYAPSLSAFHDWTICLKYQGYKVYSKWTSKIGNTTVNIYIYGLDKPNNEIIVALFKVYAGEPSQPRVYYVRISLFTNSVGEGSLEKARSFYEFHINESIAVPMGNVYYWSIAKVFFNLFNIFAIIVIIYYVGSFLIYLISKLTTR